MVPQLKYRMNVRGSPKTALQQQNKWGVRRRPFSIVYVPRTVDLRRWASSGPKIGNCRTAGGSSDWTLGKLALRKDGHAEGANYRQPADLMAQPMRTQEGR